VIRTPVSHVDFLPFILEALGEATDEFRDAGCPGHSLFELAAGGEPERTVLCEYHAMGSTTGAFMIRRGRYKYIHYVAFRPQLFDLESDPEELHDLAQDPAFAGVIADCEAKVRDICDPEEVDRRAKARQADLLEAAGGRKAVIARGDLGFTPAPGSNPEFE
jgi:arylsulfatase A-like enzyme